MGRQTLPHGTHKGVPYCVIAQVGCGCHLRTIRVPEARIPHFTRCGWIVLIRDSEMLYAALSDTWRWVDVQSGPRREGDDDEYNWTSNGDEA